MSKDVFRLMAREAFERPERSDEEGKAVFALDERLRWKSHQQSSPSLTECVASFRMVARLLSALTTGVLSPMTIHRFASRVSQSARDEELSRWEACFERGEQVCDGQRRTQAVYTYKAVRAAETSFVHALMPPLHRVRQTSNSDAGSAWSQTRCLQWTYAIRRLARLLRLGVWKQWGQDNSERDEKAWNELDYTWGAADG